MPVTFEIEIEPQPKGRPRFTRLGKPYTPEKTRKYEAELRQKIKQKYKKPPFKKHIRLELTFYLTRKRTVKRQYPIVKPDLDNLIKAFLDAANGVLYEDDAQIVSLQAEKIYAPEEFKGSICVYFY